MNPIVSVVLPVYNGERYLHKAIESILSQTYRDFELLIIDDGSTDDSQRIISGFADPRIRLLVNEHRLKLSGALNRGMTEARGKFIARMDADDIARPERLATQVKYLVKHQDIGLCGSWVKRFGACRPTVDKNPLSPEEIKAYTLFECAFAHPSVMFRKSFFAKEQLRYNGEFYPSEDFELWSRAVHLFPCVNIPKVLLDYRVHNQGMTGAEWSDMDMQGTKICRYGLSRLGIVPTDQEALLHRQLGRASCVACRSIEELDRAEGWLITLWKANQKVQVYEVDALRRILDLIWFRVCFHASGLGIVSLVRLHKRKWADRSMMPLRNTMLVLGTLVKRRILSCTPKS